jgi:hypothetical protein
MAQHGTSQTTHVATLARRALIELTMTVERAQSGLRGTAGGERMQHELQQGLHHEHPWRTVNLSDMAMRTGSQRGGRATEVRALTSAAIAWQLSDREGASPVTRENLWGNMVLHNLQHGKEGR